MSKARVRRTSDFVRSYRKSSIGNKWKYHPLYVQYRYSKENQEKQTRKGPRRRAFWRQTQIICRKILTHRLYPYRRIFSSRHTLVWNDQLKIELNVQIKILVTIRNWLNIRREVVYTGWRLPINTSGKGLTLICIPLRQNFKKNDKETDKGHECIPN